MNTRLLTICLLALATAAAMPQKTTRRLGRPATGMRTSAAPAGDTLRTDIPVRITGYEKPLRATKEPLMVTNLDTLRNLSEITLRIDYVTPDGTGMLHSRTVTLCPLVPPAQTRMMQLRSWDPNRLFYYHINRPNTSAQATPYTVTITPVTAIYR